MEFLDEDIRPRFVFQSRPSPPSSHTHTENSSKPNKICFSISISISISLTLFVLSVFYLQSEPFKSLLLWLSLSLIVGPFAPSSVTGGQIRVGQGQILEQEPIDHLPTDVDRESKKKPAHKRSRHQRPDYPPENSVPVVENVNGSSQKVDRRENTRSSDSGSVKNEEAKDWNEEDIEILKKQLTKHPAGKPGRWEAIAVAFGGRHRVESVIKKAKELAEKKTNENDDYSLFLKNRKLLDNRIAEGKTENSVTADGEAKNETWSNGEDIALLNALKTFPKDAEMRWEKIAVAVPGKSKAACLKRVADLKRDFRSSKANADS